MVGECGGSQVEEGEEAASRKRLRWVEAFIQWYQCGSSHFISLQSYTTWYEDCSTTHPPDAWHSLYGNGYTHACGYSCGLGTEATAVSIRFSPSSSRQPGQPKFNRIWSVPSPFTPK